MRGEHRGEACCTWRGRGRKYLRYRPSTQPQPDQPFKTLCVCTGIGHVKAVRGVPVAWGRVSVTHCDSLHSRMCKCFVRLICMHYLCTAGIYVKKP